MNRVVILGKVVNISKIHFDYIDKLKVYFNIYIDDLNGNKFKAKLSEKYISTDEIDRIYKKDSIGKYVCIEGFATIKERLAIVYCYNVYIL